MELAGDRAQRRSCSLLVPAAGGRPAWGALPCDRPQPVFADEAAAARLERKSSGGRADKKTRAVKATIKPIVRIGDRQVRLSS